MIITWAVLLQLLLTACSQACTQNYFYPDNSHTVNLEPILDRYSALDDKNIESFLDNWTDCISISSDNSNELDSLFWSIWNRYDYYHKDLCENDIVVLPESIPIYYHDRQLVLKDCDKYRIDLLKWSFPGDTLKMAYTPTLVKCQSRVAYVNERVYSLMRSYLEESSDYFSTQLPSGTIRICEHPSVTDIHFFRNGILYGVYPSGVLFEYVFLPSDGSLPLCVGDAYFDLASD